MSELTSRGALGGLDVDQHVRWVLDRIEPGADGLVALLDEEREDWRAVLTLGDTEVSSEDGVASDHLVDHVAWLLPPGS
jgi:hypothetical protein